MFLRVIKELVNNLSDHEMTSAYMEVVELRQRMFRGHKENVLILDPYDLIADHLLIYSSKDGKLIGYQRSVSARSCREFQLDFPIENLLKGRPEYVEGYAAFREAAREPLHMGLLCFDPAYRAELGELKIVDFTAWILFLVSGFDLESLGLAASANNRYKQDPYLRNIGEWIPGLTDLVHPLIPDPHRIVLIPKVRAGYWSEQEAKFGFLYESMEGFSTNRKRGSLKVA